MRVNRKNGLQSVFQSVAMRAGTTRFVQSVAGFRKNFAALTSHGTGILTNSATILMNVSGSHRPIRKGDLSTMKNRGCVTDFFHRGPSGSRNNLAFKALWLRSTVKNAFAVFHRGLAGFTVVWRFAPRRRLCGEVRT